MELSEKIKSLIRDINDYPKPGIVFKDITPVLSDPEVVRAIIKKEADQLRSMNLDAIAAVEARGFILGSILAYELNIPFILIRKAGKLPFTTTSQSYDLEYGQASIEMHIDAVKQGWKVLIHDDLLATGGTAAAAAELVKSAGGTIAGFSFLINLSFLPGEQNLQRKFGVKPIYQVSY